MEASLGVVARRIFINALRKSKRAKCSAIIHLSLGKIIRVHDVAPIVLPSPLASGARLASLTFLPYPHPGQVWRKALGCLYEPVPFLIAINGGKLASLGRSNLPGRLPGNTGSYTRNVLVGAFRPRHPPIFSGTARAHTMTHIGCGAAEGFFRKVLAIMNQIHPLPAARLVK